MGSSTTAPTISVRGGSGGIMARCDDMYETARRFGAAALATGDDGASMHSILGSEASVSSLLDPGGAIAFAAALVKALDGPNGVLATAARCAIVSTELTAAALAYTAADKLKTDIDATLSYFKTLPERAGRILIDLHERHYRAAGLQAADLDAQSIAFLAGPYLPRIISEISVDAALVDRHPVVKARGVGPIPTTAPSGIVSALTSLASVVDDGHDGDVTVQIITGTDAAGNPTRHVIVDIPGMGRPWPGTGDPTDLGTAGMAVDGDNTTYEAGVLAAMRLAGVRSTDDVAFVGHSMGGATAVNLASEVDASGEFNVTHIITAGAPIGGIVGKLPAKVQVMAIENSADVVPVLDGKENPDKPTVTTVTIDDDQHDFSANHDIDTYKKDAPAIEASDDPSVQSFETGMQGFFGGDSAQTYTYNISRGK